VKHVHAVDRPDVILQGTPITNLTAGYEYLVGTYYYGSSGVACWLTNYDDRNALFTTVVWSSTYQVVHEVSPVTGELIEVLDASPRIPGLQLSFDAGDARLFIFDSKKSHA
jgi:hypothetical protein